MEVANLIVNIFTAIGTVGAVIVSLALSQKKEKPKIKVMSGYVEMSKKEFYAICIFNNDISKSYSIKEIGYANKLEKKWVNIHFSKLQSHSLAKHISKYMFFRSTVAKIHHRSASGENRAATGHRG